MDLLGETRQQQALNIWASQHICKGFHIAINRKQKEKTSKSEESLYTSIHITSKYFK